MRPIVVAHPCAQVPAPHAPLQRLLLAAACCGLGACAYIPNAGPLVKDVHDEYDSDAAQHPFVLQQVSGRTIEVLKRRQEPSLAPLSAGEASLAELQIGIGDVIGVTIWEAGSQPLFASAAPAQMAVAGGASHGVALPDLTVGSDGCVSIPFAGRVPVAGRSLPAAQAAIESALHGKAQQPQVLVSFVRSLANSVTVVGEVTGGGRIPLSAHGDRVLDVLASAGGMRAPGYETWIGLSRDGVTTSVPLTQVLADARENIVLRPGDALLVSRQPETFTAFGATGHNAQFSFDSGHVNLMQAVAKAGGLDDSRADPRGVFLMRREPRALADALAGGDEVGGTEPTVPVVYQLDLMRANSYFLASDFQLRDGDVLFVSTAPVTELQKFLLLVGLITQPAISAAVTANATK
jgi:polysaccharide export outer membrane protein